MSWPIYSERLFQGGGLAGMFATRVPEGHRAVIKAGSWACGQYTGSDITLYVKAQIVYLLAFPGVYTAAVWSTFVVVYGGEEIAVLMHRDETFFSMSGFLFSDNAQGDELLRDEYQPTPVPDYPLAQPGPGAALELTRRPLA